jgi:hypothetical protein
MNVLLTKEFWETLQSALTVTALLVGGFWSYKLYRQKRQRFPQVNVTHQVNHWQLSSEKTLVRVKVCFANIGERLLSIVEGYVRLLQMQPLPKEVQQAIDEGRDPVEGTQTEIAWLRIAKRYWQQTDCEVEPKETDEAIFEFVIPNEVRTIIVESAFENKTKRRSGIRFWKQRTICWNTTTVYELNNAQQRENGSKESMSRNPGNTRREEIQRPPRDSVRPTEDRQGPARDSIRPPQPPPQTPPKQPSK